MGNKHSISEDIINALMHAGVNPSDFHRFDSAKTGKLEASEMLKLVRDKAFRLRKYAKLLDTVGMQECKTIVRYEGIFFGKNYAQCLPVVHFSHRNHRHARS